MTRFQYLVLAYALIWIALGIYLFLMNRRISRVHEEIEELRDRIRREDEDD
jgi:CcmD family protein